MQKQLLALVLCFFALVGTASAAVEVTYTFNANNVQLEAHDCTDNQCNGVIGQSSLQFPDGKSTSNGQLRVVFPDSLATPFGYALYYVSDGYLPVEGKATWHSFGQPGLAKTSFPVTFEKKASCTALVDNFAVTNDVTANVPLVIRSKASLDASTHSAFSLTNNGIAPVPPQFRDNYYSADTEVHLTIFDSQGNTVQQFPAQVFSQQNGNPLFASETRDVEFTWIPTIPGSYNAQMRTHVIDNQCTSTVDAQTTKPSFTVLSSQPQNRCDTLINNLRVLNALPVHQGDSVNVEYTRTSNFANGALTPVSTAVTFDVKGPNGQSYASNSESLGANINSGPSAHQFTFTAQQEGLNTITVTGVSNSGSCSGIPNSQDTQTLQLAIDSERKFDVEFIVSDADKGNRVVGAQISMAGRSVITNENGIAVHVDVAPGNYSADIIHPQYTRATTVVAITDFDRTFFVTLAKENRPPVLTSLPTVTIQRNAFQNVVLDLDDYVEDSEPADSQLRWTSFSTLNLQSNIEPNTNNLDLTSLGTGPGNVALTVTDPLGAFASANLNVQIVDGNNAPVLAGLPDFTLNEDAHLLDALLLDDFASDRETPDAGLSYRVISNSNAEINVSIDDSRRLDIKPSPDAFGTANVRIEVSDGVNTATDEFIVIVNPINDAPLILDVADVVTNLSLVTTVDLSLLEIDADDSASSLSWQVSLGNGAIASASIDQGAKRLTITPRALGTTQVTLTLTDASGASDTETFLYTVINGAVVGQTQCSDGIDNDGDNLADFPNDPGCSDLFDNDEINAANPPSSGSNPVCSDGLDNDNDGLADFPADLGCANDNDPDETDGVGAFQQPKRVVKLDIEQIRIPQAYELNPGDDVIAFISLENAGDADFDNLKTVMAIDELALYTSRGPKDLDEGKSRSETLVLSLASDVAPGYYSVRFSLSSLAVKRTVYREILVR